jgi:hypothetical protein
MQSLKPIQYAVTRKVSDIIRNAHIKLPDGVEPKLDVMFADAVACAIFEAGLLRTNIADEKAPVSDFIAGKDVSRWAPEVYARVERVLQHPGLGLPTTLKLVLAQAYGINPIPIIEEFERSYDR